MRPARGSPCGRGSCWPSPSSTGEQASLWPAGCHSGCFGGARHTTSAVARVPASRGCTNAALPGDAVTAASVRSLTRFASVSGPSRLSPARAWTRLTATAHRTKPEARAGLNTDLPRISDVDRRSVRGRRIGAATSRPRSEVRRLAHPGTRMALTRWLPGLVRVLAGAESVGRFAEPSRSALTRSTTGGMERSRSDREHDSRDTPHFGRGGPVRPARIEDAQLGHRARTRWARPFGTWRMPLQPTLRAFSDRVGGQSSRCSP